MVWHQRPYDTVQTRANCLSSTFEEFIFASQKRTLAIYRVSERGWNDRGRGAGIRGRGARRVYGVITWVRSKFHSRCWVAFDAAQSSSSKTPTHPRNATKKGNARRRPKWRWWEKRAGPKFFHSAWPGSILAKNSSIYSPIRPGNDAIGNIGYSAFRTYWVFFHFFFAFTFLPTWKRKFRNLSKFIRLQNGQNYIANPTAFCPL